MTIAQRAHFVVMVSREQRQHRQSSRYFVRKWLAEIAAGILKSTGMRRD